MIREAGRISLILYFSKFMIREARKISLILYFSQFVICEAMENIANSVFFAIYDTRSDGKYR